MNGRIPNPGVRPLHQGQPVAHAGAVVSRAKVAMILLHGRGGSAEDILSLAQAFAQPEIAYFAPQAAGHKLVSAFVSGACGGQRAVAFVGLASDC